MCKLQDNIQMCKDGKNVTWRVQMLQRWLKWPLIRNTEQSTVLDFYGSLVDICKIVI